MMSQTSEVPVITVAASVAPISKHLDDEQREFVTRLRRMYKAAHQAEYLPLQAEASSLCLQLEQARNLQH